jgi:YD repeat-containing protein
MRALRVGIVAVSVWLAAPACAQAARAPGCGGLVMPAAQLKVVGRGFAMVGSHTLHAGIDLMAPYGSPIRAATDGTVIRAQRYFAYGNLIDIQHAGGLVTRYGHLSAFAAGIAPGAVVRQGQMIGSVGTSGNAHGAHVHFETRVNGVAVDPKPFLALAACPTQPFEPIEEARAPDAGSGPARR